MFPDNSKKQWSRNVCLRIDLSWCFRIYPKRNCQIMVQRWFLIFLWFVIVHMTHMFHHDHHSSDMQWITVVSRHFQKTIVENRLIWMDVSRYLQETIVTKCALTDWFVSSFPDSSKKRLSRNVCLRIDLNWCFQIAPKSNCHDMCAYGLIWSDVPR